MLEYKELSLDDCYKQSLFFEITPIHYIKTTYIKVLLFHLFGITIKYIMLFIIVYYKDREIFLVLYLYLYSMIIEHLIVCIVALVSKYIFLGDNHNPLSSYVTVLMCSESLSFVFYFITIIIPYVFYDCEMIIQYLTKLYMILRTYYIVSSISCVCSDSFVDYYCFCTSYMSAIMKIMFYLFITVVNDISTHTDILLYYESLYK